ncbi:MAG: hypothetical protein K2X35_25510 [Bryobacteraceae bacterium]|nr:hypothetical protein [Bryobacteraceae bacterium]
MRLLTLFLMLAATGVCQQAIINMPSADITPKGRNFVMHETQTKWWGDNQYWLGTWFYTRGVGKNTELAVTLYNNGSPRARNEAVGLGFKSSIPIHEETREKWEMKLTVGQMAIVNTRGGGLGSFTYSHFNFRLPQTHTRFTAGGWFATEQLFKRNTGNVLFGIEHPLDKKDRVEWVTEWFAGRHDFGFLITGLLFRPAKDHVIVAAYKIPNVRANGPPGFVFEYGFFF